MVPVHLHSEYSALDGYGRPDEIASRIVDLGLPGAALTDHGTLAGLLDFRTAMEGVGLQPLLGMEAYQAPQSRAIHNKRVTGQDWDENYHLILLARNLEGYRNLLRISTEAYRTGFYYSPRTDWEMLERHHEGIVCTSACLGGLLVAGITEGIYEGKKKVGERVLDRDEWDLTSLHKFRNIFGDDFFIEIHTYDTDYQRNVNLALMELCQEYSIRPLVATDAHYPAPDQYEPHELLVAINEGKPWNMKEPRHPQCLYIMDEAEIQERLAYLPDSFVCESIASSDYLLERCQYQMPKTRLHLPKFHPDRSESDMMLIDLTSSVLADYIEGMDEEHQETYEARLERELEALIEAGLSDYFLIVWDALKKFREAGIMVGPGRGSSAGSLVAFMLNITTIDPIKYGLYFERFWNPGRAKGLPDIDIDIQRSRRGDAKAILERTYGAGRVLGIGNHIRLRPKSAIDAIGKAMDIDFSDTKAMKAILDQTTDAGQLADWDTIWDLVGEELEPFREDYPELFKMAELLSDRLKGYGAHASAVVISDVDLDQALPCMEARDNEGNRQFVTQHEMHSIEAQGFPKFDFLGLKTLDVLMDCGLLAAGIEPDTATIEEQVAIIEHFLYDVDYDEMPEEYFEIVRRHTLGIFQVEGGKAARRIAKEMEPRDVDDCGFIVALNRPGPLRSGAVDRYLERRTGERMVSYPHELLEPILEESLGEFVFQEQVISFMGEIGYSPEEADHIRKMLGKKLGKEMEEEFPRYLERAEQYMPRALAENLWDGIIEFSKYSFNKSHGISYGTITAQTIYAKNRWPVEFAVASIRNVTGQKKQEKIAALVAEARRMGIKTNGPDINISGVKATAHEGEIYFGLGEVKQVGAAAAQWIIDNGPFESYEQFLSLRASQQEEWQNNGKKGKSPNQTCSMKPIEVLRQVGAFDSISPREISQKERIALEEEFLGIVTTDIYTPVIEKHRETLQELDSYADLEDGEEVKVPGMITDVRLTRVRPDARRNAGEEMAFLTIEWQGEEARFAIFPGEWKSLKSLFRRNKVGVFTLKPGSRGPIFKKGKLLPA